MQRLIKSSKFMGPLLLTITIGVGILLGFDGEQRAELFGILAWVAGMFGVGYQGSTALEDIAKKKAEAAASAEPVSRLEGYNTAPLIAFLVLSAMTLAGSTGCSMFDPGGQTAAAMKQAFSFGLDANNNFATNGQGSQSGKFIMARGNAVKLKDDGTLSPASSELNAYLAYEPESDNVRDAFSMAMANATQQQARMADTIDNLLGLVVLGSMVPKPVSDDAGLADMIRQRVKAQIVAQIGPPPAEPVRAPDNQPVPAPPPSAAPQPPAPQPSVPAPGVSPVPAPATPAPPPVSTTEPQPAPPASRPATAPASQPSDRDAVMG